ncbi:MAG: formylglycine-generating enzyme family protein [Treponema sp.]|nr:formylglycine-generating enzyme family protein [Treponema sp.]
MKKMVKVAALIMSACFVMLFVSCQQGGDTIINNYYVQDQGLKGDFKRIPAGNYFLLYNGTGTDTTKEAEVSLSEYYICDHEVTQAEWQAVMGNNPSVFNGSTGKEVASGEVQANRPVEKVSWYDAIAYCNKRSIKEGLEPVYSVQVNSTEVDWANLKYEDIPTSSSADEIKNAWNAATCDFSKNGYRLPTEAEWEVAARGGLRGDVYAGGFYAKDDKRIGNYAWYKDNSGLKTHEVKKKKPNAYGLYDMSGNVWEWCWDWNDSTKYPSGATNPTGVASGTNRVGRGSSFNSDAYYCRASHRNFDSASVSYKYAGFRIVRSSM